MPADIFTIPPFWLGLAAFALCTSAGLGFFCGWVAARGREDREFRRARASLQTAFQNLLRHLDGAQKYGELLETFTGQKLSDADRTQLQTRSASLGERLGRMFGAAAAGLDESPLTRAMKELNWTTSPLDAPSGLPDRTAAEANLRQMLAWGQRNQQPCGMLLVRLDKFESLKERCGPLAAEALLKRFALVVCRGVRDCDVVCARGGQSFLVLLPGVDPAAGEQLARRVRDTLHRYQFRASEHGPEVLLSASLGYTPCPPGDSPELALSRVEEAASRSQRVGRNQLHSHDGRHVTHCLAS